MRHFGTHKSYDDDDEDDDIYGVDDDWQETDDKNTNLKIQNMMNKIPKGNWFITLHNNSNNKDIFINVSQIESVSFDEEDVHGIQDEETVTCGCPKTKFLNIVTTVNAYRCQLTKEDWHNCVCYFRDKNFRTFYVDPIFCINIECKSIRKEIIMSNKSKAG